MDEAGVNSEVGGPRDRVWVLERRRVDQRLGVATYRHEWIDGRACPALQAAIEALGRLPPIAMAGAATAPIGWVSDTPEVTLIGPRAGGRTGDLLLRRDLAGPVSTWWWESSEKLDACWRPTRPDMPGAHDLRPRLGSVQEEAEVMRPD